MSDVQSALCGNAVKCMELLHRIVFVWLLLCITVAFLPSAAASAQLKLPYTDVVIPVNSARWACGIVIFFSGVVGYTVLRQLRQLCAKLATTEHLVVVLSYPSIATLGTPWLRSMCGYGLAFVQYSVGYGLWAMGYGLWAMGSGLWSPMPSYLGGAADAGLAFLYAGPMFLFAWELRDWQKGITLPSASSQGSAG
jgi:hypothetical protein